jgi:hypothetical protein
MVKIMKFEKLSNDLFKKFEKEQIKQMNNVLGGGGDEPVQTPAPGYCRDVRFENGNEVWYPCS